MSDQDLFFLIAQACWDTFLIFLFALFVSTLIAYAYIGYQHINNQINKG